MEMLTETQFQVLMILFDDKGYAGWQLAEKLGVEESNLNPLLKKLQEKDFIFQGQPRKSNRPKKSKKYKESKKPNITTTSEGQKKREGDYKEFPYYIKKDLKILGSFIKEMVVTNKSYDIGFPFRVIRASNYMKIMRDTFKDDFNMCLTDLFKDLNISEIKCCEIETPIITDINEILNSKELHLNSKELHFLSFKEEMSPIKDRQVSKKLLKEMEIWWLRYEFGRCLSEDPINIKEILKMEDDIPEGYTLGEDICKKILEAVNRMPDNEEQPISVKSNPIAHDI
jgi:predicted transcriptional regulator